MKKRFRELGYTVGILPTGKLNKITDVPGVKVGHETIQDGKSTNTGVTIISPHEKNIFTNKVPAAICNGNGFGKLAGYTQVHELGNIETLIGLTNTHSVGTVVETICKYTSKLPENKEAFSINAVVGETNDLFLNNIMGFAVKEKHVLSAIKNLKVDFEEGAVGAGTGTRCFSWKGGIGSASRIIPKDVTGLDRDYTVGAILQTNFGGFLKINGVPVWKGLNDYLFKEVLEKYANGSCMIVLATDAPLSSRQLRRLAFRGVAALGATGGVFSNGSGDYAIAFSNNDDVLVTGAVERTVPRIKEELMTFFFMGALEAVEESVYNSLFMAKTIDGHLGKLEELPVDKVQKLLNKG